MISMCSLIAERSAIAPFLVLLRALTRGPSAWLRRGGLPRPQHGLALHVLGRARQADELGADSGGVGAAGGLGQGEDLVPAELGGQVGVVAEFLAVRGDGGGPAGGLGGAVKA